MLLPYQDIWLQAGGNVVVSVHAMAVYEHDGIKQGSMFFFNNLEATEIFCSPK